MSRQLVFAFDRVECVKWNGRTDRDGYGRTAQGRLAHRTVWEELHGKIPRGLCVLHHCDNPSCVNVLHLFVGTQADNMLDMHHKGRGFAKLSRALADQMRLLNKEGYGYKRLARMFGVNRTTVRRIVFGKHWNHPIGG